MERLLDYFSPTRYQLEECIFRHEERFKGKVQIDGNLRQNKVIKLHAVGLDIKKITWRPYWRGYEDPSDEYGSEPCQYTYNGQVIEIPITPNMDKILQRCSGDGYLVNGSPEPDITLEITFESKLNKNMQGCYLSTYNWNGEKKYIVATQFESHYAREAFPCIDEPAAKAIFELTIIDPDYDPSCDVVLANTPVIGQANGRFEFAATPKMSTYLLAWVIGPLQSVSTVNKNGVRVTSYAALNQPIESLLFANETAARALEYYDQEFQEKYPLEKLDQVALPDFEAGAMENWGLVTYRESMMLCNKDSAISTKQSVALTVTHELAHQWFGNLVTMLWWDDLWLNESFASMMEYFCTDALYPEFKAWQEFFTHDAVAALRRDCLPGVQAVKQAVHHPAEIATLFDGAIVYAKGARLMLMLNRLMGEENFKKGLRDYFDRFKYGNTTGDDLWNSLQPYADFAVKDFMHAWISQPGYPAILDGEQHRFLINGESDDTTWPLPEIFDDMSGHYLLNLTDAEFTEKLTELDDLSMEQRLRVLIDRLLLAKTPAVASDSLLDLLPKFINESSAAVWDILTSLVNDLKLFCPPDTPTAHHYQEFLKKLFKDHFAQLDYGDLAGDADAIALRDAFLGIAIYVRDEAILAKLNARYYEDLMKIDPELRGSILAAHFLMDEAAAFPYYLEQYRTTPLPELKSDLLFVLAAFAEQPDHLDQLLKLLSQPEIVRPQDHLFLYIYLLRNHHTREQTLDWLIENWTYVEELTGEKSIEDYPRYAAALIRTPEEAKKFSAFFGPKADDPVLKRTLKMAQVEINSRLALIDHDTAGVEEKLNLLAKTKK